MGGQKVLSANIKPKPKYKPYTPYVKYDHTFYGKKWYTNLVPSSEYKGKCLMDDYRQEDLRSHLVICYTKQYTPDYVQHLYAVFDSYIEFYNYYIKFEMKDRCFYEIIQFYQKPHFDLDLDSPTYIKHYSYNKPYQYDEFFKVGTILIETLVRACKVIMLPNLLNLEKDVLVYTSHGKSKGKDKLSYHVIINHWCHIDEIEAGAFFEKVSHLTACLLEGKYVEWLDKSVYKSRQNFRLLGSHKFDTEADQITNRTKKFESSFQYFDQVIVHEPDILNIAEKYSHFSKSLITFTSGCQLLQSFGEHKNYENYDYDISEKDLEEIKVMLYKVFKDQFTIRDIKKHKIFLKKRNPYYCPICYRVHPHENPMIVVYHGVVKFDCRRHDDKKKLLLGHLTTIENTAEKLDIVEEPDYTGVKDPFSTGNFLSFGDYIVDLTNGNIDLIDNVNNIDNINNVNNIDNINNINNINNIDNINNVNNIDNINNINNIDNINNVNANVIDVVHTKNPDISKKSKKNRYIESKKKTTIVVNPVEKKIDIVKTLNLISKK